jgi:hypothetical protein
MGWLVVLILLAPLVFWESFEAAPKRSVDRQMRSLFLFEVCVRKILDAAMWCGMSLKSIRIGLALAVVLSSAAIYFLALQYSSEAKRRKHELSCAKDKSTNT